MHAIQDIIDLALREDIGPGDITTDNLIPKGNQGKGIILANRHQHVVAFDNNWRFTAGYQRTPPGIIVFRPHRFKNHSLELAILDDHPPRQAT